MSAEDKTNLKAFLENGTPCVPFIPVNELLQSMSELKPEGFNGYFVAKVPALYQDGSIRHLYKEEFSLLTAAKSLAANAEQSGRTYFFFGLDILVNEADAKHPYISPSILYQSSLTLFDIEFLDDVEFFTTPLSPTLELCFLPVDKKIKVGRVHNVNFVMVAQLYPPEERSDPSSFILSYDEWKHLQYPTQGQGLSELFEKHIQNLKVMIG